MAIVLDTRKTMHTPNLMFPDPLNLRSDYRRELTPMSEIASAGCRGVTGPVPQPLFMKPRLAPGEQT